MANHTEDSLLWVLSDSNLPTGGFIASAGLESYFAHGFLTSETKAGAADPTALVHHTVAFVDHALTNYVSSVLPFLHASFRVAEQFLAGGADLDTTVHALAWLDAHHHTLLLNHVSRRASLIQGIAMLSLYARSFSQPASEGEAVRSAQARKLIEHVRRQARRGSAKLSNGASSLDPAHAELAGHLPICAGLFGACVGLSLERALRHNLFLQARNTMSCSIRLNTLGPYMAHQLLVFQLRDLTARRLLPTTAEAGERLYKQAYLRCSQPAPTSAPLAPEHEVWDWDWDDVDADAGYTIPATAYPLGEIVQARHDQLHSRLFNS